MCVCGGGVLCIMLTEPAYLCLTLAKDQSNIWGLGVGWGVFAKDVSVAIL